MFVRSRPHEFYETYELDNQVAIQKYTIGILFFTLNFGFREIYYYSRGAKTLFSANVWTISGQYLEY